MYRKQKMQNSTMKCNNAYIAETIEQKVFRITTNKEPIKDTSPPIYTERKDGVEPAYDMRTDRFQLAVNAHNTIASAQLARREGRMNERGWTKDEKGKWTKSKGEGTEGQSTEGTTK